MREWKDVLLSVVGGGVLLGLKRLAYRSVRSAVVIVLAIGLGVTLLAGLAIADIHLVQNNLTPMHVSWRGWATLAVAIVVGVVLMIELGDVAHSSPASFQSRSQRFDGFRRWISLIATGTWPGRFLGWLTTPRGSLRWLASIGVVTAASIVLSIPGLVAAIVSNGSDFWAAVFALSLPLGPLWWLLLLAVVAASPAGRHPAGGLPFALFAAVPALSVAVFVVVLLAPAVYDTSGSPTTGYALFAALAIETWVFWLLWAGIALSAPLRIVFLPVVLLCLSTIPMYYGLLPFLGLVGVLSVGVPWALWRSRPASVTP
jgi:hypothetical protein